MGGKWCEKKTESKSSWTLFFFRQVLVLSITRLQLFSTRVLETHLGGLKAACIGSAVSKFRPSVGDGATYCIYPLSHFSFRQEFLVSDSESSCTIRVDGGSGGQAAVLCLTLPPSYPSLSPPSYSYSAPFLSSREKQELEASLQEVYLEHMGESLLYLWVEKVREVLEAGQEDLETEEEMTDCDTEAVSELETAPCPAIVTGPVLEDRRSVFQGHTARVTSLQEVARVME